MFWFAVCVNKWFRKRWRFNSDAAVAPVVYEMQICTESVGINYIFLVYEYAEAYDALDPNGNITIKWDIMNWTPDGYVVSV